MFPGAGARPRQNGTVPHGHVQPVAGKQHPGLGNGVGAAARGCGATAENGEEELEPNDISNASGPMLTSGVRYTLVNPHCPDCLGKYRLSDPPPPQTMNPELKE